MKTTLFAIFLLSAFTLHLLSATAQPVFDTDGDFVRNGATYYIVPFLRGKGGGLQLAAIGVETCPLSVVQAPFEISYGLPITISSPYRTTTINTGSPLVLSFGLADVPNCAPTGEWSIVKGAVKLTDSRDAQSGRFTIERYGGGRHSLDSYKLAFCPSLSLTCKDLGISIDDDGNRRLVVNKREPFSFAFMKADTYASAK